MACKRRGPKGCSCNCGCSTDCGDGTNEIVCQLDVELADLIEQTVFWRKNYVGFGGYSYEKIILDLRPYNGTYTFTKDANCIFTTTEGGGGDWDRSTWTETIPYEFIEYSGINPTASPDGEMCPSYVLQTATGTTDVVLTIYPNIVNDAGWFVIARFDIQVTVDGTTYDFMGKYKLSTKEPCASQDFEMDTRTTAADGSQVCDGVDDYTDSPYGGIHIATTTPSAT